MIQYKSNKYLILYFKRFFVATSRQVKRIESASRSPIYSHFSESLTGMSVIRACNKKTLFSMKMFELIDKTISYNQANIFTSRWLGFRLETCGNLFTLLACIFVIINRDTITPGDTGMIISLTLSVSLIKFNFTSALKSKFWKT
jgi:ABC-type multidrug transport system fused ATPase/permease subunit